MALLAGTHDNVVHCNTNKPLTEVRAGARVCAAKVCRGANPS